VAHLNIDALLLLPMSHQKKSGPLLCPYAWRNTVIFAQLLNMAILTDVHLGNSGAPRHGKDKCHSAPHACVRDTAY
jgi:hypothetical protein